MCKKENIECGNLDPLNPSSECCGNMECTPTGTSFVCRPPGVKLPGLNQECTSGGLCDDKLTCDTSVTPPICKTACIAGSVGGMPTGLEGCGGNCCAGSVCTNTYCVLSNDCVKSGDPCTDPGGKACCPGYSCQNAGLDQTCQLIPTCQTKQDMEVDCPTGQFCMMVGGQLECKKQCNNANAGAGVCPTSGQTCTNVENNWICKDTTSSPPTSGISSTTIIIVVVCAVLLVLLLVFAAFFYMKRSGPAKTEPVEKEHAVNTG